MKVTSIQIPPELDDPHLEVINIDYDLWTLRITAKTEKWPVVYIDFDHNLGFRVLNESALYKYYADHSTKDYGRLWQIDAGGWLEQEMNDNWYYETEPNAKEFLILGIEACVNVIANNPPKITIPN